jgi:glutathione S-transferase
MSEARLVTIAMSHYCEKARWVLDATGIPYREEAHAPVAHLFATRPAGGKTVPLLVHDGRVFGDSTEIARYAESLARKERRLVPEEPEAQARVLAMEEELDETIGIDARLLAYWFELKDRERARALVARMMRLRSPLAQRVVAPLFRTLIFRKYRVSEHAAELAIARVRATFARLGKTLETSDYLVGDRFTLADLTFAALASPMLAPPEHPITGRAAVTPAPEVAALRAELAAMPAGRHVLRVYREHRGVAGVV